MVSTLAKTVADFLGLPCQEALELAARAPRSYRSYRVQKKRGGQRRIFHPSKETKGLQYALMKTYLSRLPVNEAAMAYRKGLPSPLKTNALQHAPFRFTVRLDVADFFPSITPAVLSKCLRELAPADLRLATTEDKEFLRDVLFVRVGRRGLGLAIGAPSSPMVSNFVMMGADKALTKLSGEITGVYTRYADDLYFSTDERGGCRRFADQAGPIVRSKVSGDFSMNREKELFMSRGTKRIIAGIVVCPDGSISLGRSRKRYVRAVVNRFRYGDLNEGELLALQGLLAYILDVEPEFYNRLAQKYGARVVRRALQGGGRKVGEGE